MLVPIHGPLVFVFEVHWIFSNKSKPTANGGQPRAIEIADGF